MCWRKEPALVPHQSGLSCDQEPAVCLDPAVSGARRSRFCSRRATASPPEVERAYNAEQQVAHLERLCGQQALELDVLREEVDLLKKAWHQPIKQRHALIERLRELMPGCLCGSGCILLAYQSTMVLPASPSLCGKNGDRSPGPGTARTAERLFWVGISSHSFRTQAKWVEDQSQASGARHARGRPDL